MELDRLAEDDVERLGLDVLVDLRRRIVASPEPLAEHVGPAAEDHQAVAGEEVGEAALDKAVDRHEHGGPGLLVDLADPLLLGDHERFDRLGDPDDPVPAAGEDVSHRGLARARRPGDPDHHADDSARTADKNLSFSQSAPTETRR